MSFVERLKQELALKAQLAEQKATQEKLDKENVRLQTEVAERERRTRRQQAEGFREQSGVGNLVEELRTILPSAENGCPGDSLKNPDSAWDGVMWDRVTSRNGNSYSQKYIVVETCPDGTIIFHGGLFGSTTIEQAAWRNNNSKEIIFEKSLEKAFRRPGTHRFSIYQDPGHANG